MQDEDLIWNTEDPDFTPCFLQSALVYAPAVFLFLFTPLDFYYSYTNKYSWIPYSAHNISRFLVIALLVIHSIVDLVYATTWEPEGETFMVHTVAPIIRILMFVSWT